MRNVWNLLARNPNYRLVLGANLISSAGDWILGIGMMYYVFTVTGSALASGTILLVSILPQFVLGSIGGVFVDRWDRRKTMVVTNTLLAVSLVPLYFVHSQSQIWIVYVSVFLEACLEQFFTPAEAALIPWTVPEEDLVAANALNGQSGQVARLVGSALGGALAAAGGITLVATFDLVSYAVAACLIALIGVGKRAATEPEPAAEETAEEPEEETGGPRTVFRQWRDGIALCTRKPELRTILIYRMISFFGEGVFAALLAPFIIKVLHASGFEYGAIISVQAVGGIAGGLAVASLGRRGRPITLLGYGAFFFGVFDLLIAVYPVALSAMWPMFVFVIIVGLPAASLVAGYSTLQQTLAEDAYRGRVFGAISSSAAVTMMLGAALGGTLSDRIGIIPVIAVQGVIHIIAGPVVLRRLRRYAADDDTPVTPGTALAADPGEVAAPLGRDLVGDA
jgi:Na+/melibiose symporter-like transporter